MNKCISAGIVFLLTASSIAYGQAQEEPSKPAAAPAPPYVAKKPLQGRWKVQYTYRDSAASAQKSGANDPAEAAQHAALLRRRIKEATYEIQGVLQHEEIITADGRTTEFWFVKKMGLCKEEGDEEIRIIDSRFESSTADIGSSDFREFAWITANHYAGEVMLGSRRCHHFKGESTLQEAPGVQSKKTTMEAWIDAETKLPVALNDGTALREYRFDLVSPATPLQLPPAFAKRLERYNQKMKRYGM